MKYVPKFQIFYNMETGPASWICKLYTVTENSRLKQAPQLVSCSDVTSLRCLILFEPGALQIR